MDLRYGLNPHQRPASAVALDPLHPPLRLLNGTPSYINVLDAMGAWQLVSDASTALGRPAATSFKHTSPAGAALAGPIDAVMAESYRLDSGHTGPLTSAYVRARDADPKSSYGDFVAVSGPVDAELADLLRRLVCDGIIAPGYEPGVVAALSAKRGGRFLVPEADPDFQPPAQEVREVYGLRLLQPRDDVALTREWLPAPQCGPLPAPAAEDLLLGLIVVALHPVELGCVPARRDGAGHRCRPAVPRRLHPPRVVQGGKIQERVNEQIQALTEDRTLLSAAEHHDWVGQLGRVAFVSDAALPFPDNIDHARRHGVSYIAEPGGSLRSGDVQAACEQHSITLVHTGLRLFRH